MAIISQNYTDSSTVQLDSDNLLLGILTFIGSVLVGTITALWRKVSGEATKTALLKQAQDQYDQQRLEDREDRTAARDAMVERVDLHHKIVVEKIDGLGHRVERLEKTVRNGHG
jgi:hypothetical protein